MMKAGISRVVALGLILGSGVWSYGQNGPSGNYAVSVTGAENLVWDLTALDNEMGDYRMSIGSDSTEVQLSFPRHFKETGSGSLVTIGTGDTDVNMELWDSSSEPIQLTFPGKYKVSGSITSNRGVCKVKMVTSVTGKANLQNANRSLSASETISASVNNATFQVTGTSQSKASASGLGSMKSSDTISDDIASMQGGWVMNLTGLATTGNKVTGTASVTLHSGAIHQFSVKGTYNSKTGISKLVLMGLDVAKGGNLTVTMGSGNKVTLIKGKVFGQMVNFTPLN